MKKTCIHHLLTIVQLVSGRVDPESYTFGALRVPLLCDSGWPTTLTLIIHSLFTLFPLPLHLGNYYPTARPCLDIPIYGVSSCPPCGELVFVSLTRYLIKPPLLSVKAQFV